MGLIFDLLAVAGIVLIAVGLWLVAPWLSLLVTGLILFAAGILGGRAWARPDPTQWDSCRTQWKRKQ
jgi:hypothetical protein